MFENDPNCVQKNDPEVRRPQERAKLRPESIGRPPGPQKPFKKFKKYKKHRKSRKSKIFYIFPIFRGRRHGAAFLIN